MTNPTAGYSYNICVNDNDFGGACMKRLRFTADMTKEQKRNTVEAALLLGFQAETAVFPVAAADGEIPVPETKEEFRKLWKKTGFGPHRAGLRPGFPGKNRIGKNVPKRSVFKRSESRFPPGCT